MWYFTEIADWFEDKRRQSFNVLDHWVEDSSYNQTVMIVAASSKAFTTFGAGFVDVLRLGDGVKQGTLKGIGKDALRFVAVFPVGKVASLVKSAKGIALAKVIVDTGGPNCFWVASAKAFGQIGHKFNGKLLASVDDIAKALGMDMNCLWQIPNLSTGMLYLKRLVANIGAVKTVTSTKEIEPMIPLDGSVVMIAVNVIANGRIIAGHAIYAFRTTFGQVRYMDRTVGSVSPRFFNNIGEIAPLYGATALAPYEAAVIHNVFVKSILHDIPILAMPILGVIATEGPK